MAHLQSAVDEYNKAKNEFAAKVSNKNTIINQIRTYTQIIHACISLCRAPPLWVSLGLSQATEEEMRLLRFQKKLEEEKGESLVGFSLHDTIRTLLAVGLHKHAEQLYKDFRVPDKRYILHSACFLTTYPVLQS